MHQLLSDVRVFSAARLFKRRRPIKPDRRLELFSLMSRGDDQEHKPLSLKESADRLEISIKEARGYFADPSAWRTIVNLVEGRSKQ